VGPGFESLIRHHPFLPRRPTGRRVHAPTYNAYNAVRGDSSTQRLMFWSRFARLAATALAAALLASPAAAQLRTIPADAERGVMRHISGMTVELNGETVRLGTGAQIRDASNRIILPGMLPPESLVKYKLDLQGQVHRIWILSPEEAAQPDPEK
jgi:hypothetical protein